MIVVLATLGPSNKNYQESLSTLQFASRCKEVVLQPLLNANIIEDDEEVASLKEKLMEMQMELDTKEQQFSQFRKDK